MTRVTYFRCWMKSDTLNHTLYLIYHSHTRVTNPDHQIKICTASFFNEILRWGTPLLSINWTLLTGPRIITMDNPELYWSLPSWTTSITFCYRMLCPISTEAHLCNNHVINLPFQSLLVLHSFDEYTTKFLFINKRATKIFLFIVCGTFKITNEFFTVIH